MSSIISRCASVLVLLTASACLGAPNDDRASADGDVMASSEQGLVDAHLEVVGSLSTGSNDFRLTLTPRDSSQAARLESFRATMPAHGHASAPDHIAADSNDYSIIELPLAMPGRWQLTASLLVGNLTDRVDFDIDVP